MARRSKPSDQTPRPSFTPAKRKGIPLSPLANQMLHDMQLAGLADRTQESYLRAVRKFAQWLFPLEGCNEKQSLPAPQCVIYNSSGDRCGPRCTSVKGAG